MAVQLRLAEKVILEKALASGRAKREHFQKRLEEGAPLPNYQESSVALLEDADAKLPIILHKLGEIQEGRHIQFEESGAAVQSAELEMNVEADGRALKPEPRGPSEEEKTLDALGTNSQNGQREVTGVGAGGI